MRTAYNHWDSQWQTSKGRQEWVVPEAAVTGLLPSLQEKGTKHILDLGGGVGRHALYFAAYGFKVYMTDLSSHGLQYVRETADAAGVKISTHLAEMTALPFDASFFDYVLAWNVIYHGNRRSVIQVLAEVNRVLEAGGLFQTTLLSKQNVNFGVGHEVSEDTWINNGKSDKDHPHYYCNQAEVFDFFSKAGFLIKDLEEAEQSSPGSYHWNIVAKKIN